MACLQTPGKQRANVGSTLAPCRYLLSSSALLSLQGPCINLLGSVTKYHKLGASTLWKSVSSQFWRLEV